MDAMGKKNGEETRLGRFLYGKEKSSEDEERHVFTYLVHIPLIENYHFIHEGYYGKIKGKKTLSSFLPNGPKKIQIRANLQCQTNT